MAAFVRNLRFCRRNILRIYSRNDILSQRFTSTSSNIVETSTASVDNAEIDQIDDKIELKRDVSGLSERQAAKLNHRAKIMPPKYEHELKLYFKRKQYARFGRASGLDPSIMWPTKEELTAMKADEMEWDLTFDQLVQKVRNDEETARKEREEKIQKVEKSMAKMPELIAAHKQKLKAKEEQLHKQEAKKQKLLEDAREFFGFDIDPKDARFKQMQELKEKEEEKLAKQRKKESRLARLHAKLTGIS